MSPGPACTYVYMLYDYYYVRRGPNSIQRNTADSGAALRGCSSFKPYNYRKYTCACAACVSKNVKCKHKKCIKTLAGALKEQRDLFVCL